MSDKNWISGAEFLWRQIWYFCLKSLERPSSCTPPVNISSFLFPQKYVLKIIVFWDKTPCSLIKFYLLIGGQCCVNLIVRKEIFEYHEDGGIKLLRNMDTKLPINTTPYLKITVVLHQQICDNLTSHKSIDASQIHGLLSLVIH